MQENGRHTQSLYTKGEWVSELTEYLDITLAADVDDIDYYFADTEQSEYGVAIEIAQAYGILPEPDVEDVDQDIPYFEPDEIATREFAAYTAVQAMGFFGDYTIDTSSWKDWEDITYQTQAALAIQMGFLSLEEDYFLPDDILDTKDCPDVGRNPFGSGFTPVWNLAKCRI